MNVSRADFEPIEKLDFEQIKHKLMHKGGGKAWSMERVEAAEREYRRFLYLMKKYPDEMTAPSMEVDRFWHQHILDTRKYAQDCEAVFGYFLHHYPYLGIGGADDEALRQQAGQRMRDLYQHTFGQLEAAGAESAAADSTIGYCTVTQAIPRTDALREDVAYCTVTSARPAQDAGTGTAYCTVTALTAYCTVTAATAYCTVTAPRAKAAADDTAYCTVTAKAAYCTVLAPPRSLRGRVPATRVRGAPGHVPEPMH
jgi:hypothetical protein